MAISDDQAPDARADKRRVLVQRWAGQTSFRRSRAPIDEAAIAEAAHRLRERTMHLEPLPRSRGRMIAAIILGTVIVAAAILLLRSALV